MIEESCVFCDIVRGDAPASVVYADDRLMAFMDIRPVNPGHLLIIPRAHVARLADLDGALGARLFQVGMNLAQAVCHANVHGEGVNLFLADGKAAGQEVFHVHLHVIPRFEGDGFGFYFSSDYYRLPGRAMLDELAASIRQALEDLT